MQYFDTKKCSKKNNKHHSITITLFAWLRIGILNKYDLLTAAKPAERVFAGNRFRSSVTTNLCASELLMAADQVTKVRFTYKGAKLCDDVCAQYMQTMRTEGEVEVDLMRSYCDFTGSTYATAGEYDLSSTCTCGYKVRCNQRTKMVAYAFRPNPRGFLKVSVTKFSDTKDIT